MLKAIIYGRLEKYTVIDTLNLFIVSVIQSHSNHLGEINKRHKITNNIVPLLKNSNTTTKE